MTNIAVRGDAVSYHIVESDVAIDGITVRMYGVEGISGGEILSLEGLSENVKRIEKLVDNINESGLELFQLREVVQDFLFDCYGVHYF